MNAPRILITGSAGLIGRAVSTRLRAEGAEVVSLDLRAEQPASRGDLCDPERLAAAIADVDGILHLGAVSRVVDGERDPERCWSVNVEGTRLVRDLAEKSAKRPWLIYASSREVYGQQTVLPVPEHAPLQPKNVYARSKAAAEGLIAAGRAIGMTTAILRFSNVYGDIDDHGDRVVPAFARAAALAPAQAGVLRVDGSDCTFDFTHVDDVADGILRVMARLRDGETELPPIHFVAGRQTSLGQLAQLAMQLGGPNLTMTEAPARGFDVHRFAGDPAAADKLLGWRTTTTLESGFARLVNAYRTAAEANHGLGKSGAASHACIAGPITA